MFKLNEAVALYPGLYLKLPRRHVNRLRSSPEETYDSLYSYVNRELGLVRWLGFMLPLTWSGSLRVTFHWATSYPPQQLISPDTRIELLFAPRMRLECKVKLRVLYRVAVLFSKCFREGLSAGAMLLKCLNHCALYCAFIVFFIVSLLLTKRHIQN